MESKPKDCGCQGGALATQAASPTATRKGAAQNTAFHTAHNLAAAIKNHGPGQTKELTKALCKLLLLGLRIKEA